MKGEIKQRFACAVLVLLLLACRLASPGQEKIKGVSFVAPVNALEQLNTLPISEIHANWVCLMPYAYVDGDSLVYNSPWQWWGERTEGISFCIRSLQQKGFKVMLKPHLWLKHGSYTGDFTAADWQRWEQAYEKYIFEFVQLAAEYNIELFCIGTELRSFVQARPEFWSKLIEKIRSQYNGKLTYAANWDDYHQTRFWNQLDYIGIDAYFPLCTERDTNHTIESLVMTWKKHKTKLQDYAGMQERQILFTEAGYRSVEKTCYHPWEQMHGAAVSQEAQRRAYQALFESFWEEKWFAGMFIWKWYNQPEALPPLRYDTDYTPQGKRAEEVLKKRFAP